MGKYRIEFDRANCISAFACIAVAPDQWHNADDGKVDFTKEEFDDDELAKNMDAAQVCPVRVIHIINKETGEELI
ncbi:ferredoxin [Candidatus Micrarchaeota archaeon]|nr:ferredoxin [Candidatus Micrarchaeota archaeon]